MWPSSSLDVAKGAAAVLLAGAGAGIATQALVATLAVAGHIYPVWLRGRGGKGLAAAAGALSAISPLSVPLWAVAWAVGYATSGYIALGIIAATALLPVLLGIVAGWAYALAALPVCLLVLVAHRARCASCCWERSRNTTGAEACNPLRFLVLLIPG